MGEDGGVWGGWVETWVLGVGEGWVGTWVLGLGGLGFRAYLPLNQPLPNTVPDSVEAVLEGFLRVGCDGGET